MKQLIIIFSFLLLTACHPQNYLTVQSDYISYKNLASYYVGTPDPRMNCPPIGQRLIIMWSVPEAFLEYDDLSLLVTIRFRDRQEQTEVFALNRKRGTYVFTLMNDDYCAHGGIMTYKVDLIGGGCLLEEWRHQVWAELIEVKQEHEEEAEDESFEAIDWQEDAD